MAAPSSREPSISFRVYETISLNPEKYGFVNVVSPLSITDVKQLSTDRTRTSSSTIGIHGISEERGAMVYWSLKGGLVTMKHANSQVPGKVLSAFPVKSNRTGFFYCRDAKHPLGFMMLDHDSNPCHVKLKATKFETELMNLFEDVYPKHFLKSKSKEEIFSLFEIRCAKVSETDIGDVLVAIVWIPFVEKAYVITAALKFPESWRRWTLSASRVSVTECFIAPDGKSVHLLSASIQHPRQEEDNGAPRRCVEKAFSCMEQVAADVDDQERCAPSSTDSSVDVCFCVQQTIVPLSASKDIENHFYESACACVPWKEWQHLKMNPVRLHSERDTLLLTALVPMMSDTYILHFTFNTEEDMKGGYPIRVKCSCQQMRGLQGPLSMTTVEGVTLPDRGQKTTLSVVLSSELKVYACEVFGEAAQSNLENLSSIPIFVPQASKKQKIGVNEKTKGGKRDFIKLTALPNGEVLFSNGAIAHFICITYLFLPGAAPSRLQQCPPLTLLDASEQSGEGYTALLHRALNEVNEWVSVCTDRQAIIDVFTSRVLPRLRFLNSSTMEMHLIQMVYRRVLDVASPITEQEWNLLWDLTRLVQQIIARRNRETATCYMDAFFLQLAQVYKESSFASPEGVTALKEALLNVVSNELRQSILVPVSSDAVEYLFGSIADGISYLTLASNLIHRLASVSVTDQGMCLAYSSKECAPVLHAMGFILLSSCMDVPIYLLSGKEAYDIVCDVKPPLCNTSSLFVPVQCFENQNDFNQAIALAADLLSCAPATSYSEVEATIFTIFISQRYHCAPTLFELLSPVLTEALTRAAPIYNNKEWFEECAYAISLNGDEEVKRLARADGKHPVLPSLCFALRNQSGGLNLSTYNVLTKHLPEEVSSACLIVFVFSLTERMVAAQNNYAAGVMKLLQTVQPLERESEQAFVDVLEERLHAIVQTNREVWGCVHNVLPFKAKDLAQSYVASLGMSRSGAWKGTEPAGTMLSRTLVMCYRIFVCVSFSLEAMDYMDKSWQQFVNRSGPWDNRTATHTPEERCLSSLRYLFLAEESVIPKEWFQCKLLRVLRAAHKAETPLEATEWTSFLLRLLDLSDISVSCNLAGLKKEFFELTDELRADLRSGINSNDVPSALKNYYLIAEEIAAAHRANSYSSISAGDFIFSQRRDPSLPRWAFRHDRRERKYLIDVEWVHHMWALENDTELITSIATAVADQVLWEAQQKSKLCADSTFPTPSSVVLARPLFASVHEVLLPGHSLVSEVHDSMSANALIKVPQWPSISAHIVESSREMAVKAKSLERRDYSAVPVATVDMKDETAVSAVAALPPVIASPFTPSPSPANPEVQGPTDAVQKPAPETIELRLSYTAAAPAELPSNAALIPTAAPDGVASSAEMQAGTLSLPGAPPAASSTPGSGGPSQSAPAPALTGTGGNTPPPPPAVATSGVDVAAEKPSAAETLETERPTAFLSANDVAWWEVAEAAPSAEPRTSGAQAKREEGNTAAKVGVEVKPCVPEECRSSDTITTFTSTLERRHRKYRDAEYSSVPQQLGPSKHADVMSWNSDHLRPSPRHDALAIRRYARQILREEDAGDRRRTGVRCCTCRRQCPRKDKPSHHFIGDSSKRLRLYDGEYLPSEDMMTEYSILERKRPSRLASRQLHHRPSTPDLQSTSRTPAPVATREAVPLSPTVVYQQPSPPVAFTTAKPYLIPAPGPLSARHPAAQSTSELRLLSLPDRHSEAFRGLRTPPLPTDGATLSNRLLGPSRSVNRLASLHLPFPIPSSAQPPKDLGRTSSPPLLKLSKNTAAQNDRVPLAIPPQRQSGGRILGSGTHNLPIQRLHIPPSTLVSQMAVESQRHNDPLKLLSLHPDSPRNVAQPTSQILAAPPSHPPSDQIKTIKSGLTLPSSSLPVPTATSSSLIAPPVGSQGFSAAPLPPEPVTPSAAPAPIGFKTSTNVSYDAALVAFLEGRAPAAAPTPAPVSTSTPAPVSLSTPAPVSTSTPAPVSLSTPAPVSLSTPAPVSTSTPAPVSLSTPAPVSLSTPAPVSLSTPTPAPAPASVPPAPVPAAPTGVALAHPPLICPAPPSVQLTPSEQVDFNRYVTELKSQGAADALRIAAPLPSGTSAVSLVEEGMQPSPSPGCQAQLRFLCDQQKTFLEAAQQLLQRRDGEAETLCQKIGASVTAALSASSRLTPYSSAAADGLGYAAPSGVLPAPQHTVAPAYPPPSAPPPCLDNLPPPAAVPIPSTAIGATGLVLPASCPTATVAGDLLQKQRDELLVMNAKTLEKEIEEARAGHAATTASLTQTVSVAGATGAPPLPADVPAGNPIPIPIPTAAVSSPSPSPVAVATTPSQHPPPAVRSAPTPTTPRQRPQSPGRWTDVSTPPKNLQELYHRAAVNRCGSRVRDTVRRPTASSAARSKRLAEPTGTKKKGRAEKSTETVTEPAPLPPQEKEEEELYIPSWSEGVQNLYVDRQVNRRKENIMKRVALLNREFA